MATLIPSLNSCLPRMTAGERRLAERLESHLEDDYLVWYDVPVGDKYLNPDFLILHPHRGIFVLEVKDWKLDSIQRVTRTSVTLLASEREVKNPLMQVQDYGVVCTSPRKGIVHNKTGKSHCQINGLTAVDIALL